MTDHPDALLDKLAAALRADADLSVVLQEVLSSFDCVVGTIHRFDNATGMLSLLAHRGIPAAIMDKVQRIPIGKGMAGLAAQRREPVQVCNIQTDDTGVAKPGAKLTQMEGSLAAPMLVGDELCGTIGVAKPTSYEFSEAEAARLMAVGALIGAHLSQAG